MNDLHSMLDAVIKAEGGYVLSPNDHGSCTNFGITLKTLQSWRGDLKLDCVDVHNLTEHEAREIYTARYYHGGKVNHAPERVRGALFDACVNHGIARAWKLLQRAANEQGCGLTVDGVPGVKTFTALTTCGEKKLLEDFIRERRLFYTGIANNDASQKVFLKGWLARLQNFA